MRFKIVGILLVFFIIIITLGCAPRPWLPESDVKVQNLRKEISRQVMKLAENDNYFPSYFVMQYVRSAMNSLNKNNGQAIIIAHDGLKNAKITFILDSDENIRKLTVQQYSKDLGELFKKCNIDQEFWGSIIQKFNGGEGETATVNGYITLSYDFKKDSFLIKREHDAGPPRWRMSTIRTR